MQCPMFTSQQLYHPFLHSYRVNGGNFLPPLTRACPYSPVTGPVADAYFVPLVSRSGATTSHGCNDTNYQHSSFQQTPLACASCYVLQPNDDDVPHTLHDLFGNFLSQSDLDTRTKVVRSDCDCRPVSKNHSCACVDKGKCNKDSSTPTCLDLIEKCPKDLTEVKSVESSPQTTSAIQKTDKKHGSEPESICNKATASSPWTHSTFLPGFTPSDIRVKVKDRRIFIHARHEKPRGPSTCLSRLEMCQTIPLPKNVDEQTLKCFMKPGGYLEFHAQTAPLFDINQGIVTVENKISCTKLSENNPEVMTHKKVLASKEEKMEVLEDKAEKVEALENKTVKVEALEDKAKMVEALEDKAEKMEALEDKAKKMEALEDKAEKVEALENKTVKVEALEDKAKKVEALEDKAEKMEALEDKAKMMEALEDKAEKMEALEDKAEKMEALEDKTEKVEVLEDKAEKVEALEDNAEKAEALEDKAEKVEALEDKVEKVEALEVKAEKMEVTCLSERIKSLKVLTTETLQENNNEITETNVNPDHDEAPHNEGLKQIYITGEEDSNNKHYPVIQEIEGSCNNEEEKDFSNRIYPIIQETDELFIDDDNSDNSSTTCNTDFSTLGDGDETGSLEERVLLHNLEVLGDVHLQPLADERLEASKCSIIGNIQDADATPPIKRSEDSYRSTCDECSPTSLTSSRNVDVEPEAYSLETADQNKHSALPPCETTFCVSLPLIGFNPQDIHVTLKGHSLTINAEHQVHLPETSYSERLERRVELPTHVNASTVKCRFEENGYLVITAMHYD